jgi:hypothetical protein
LAVAKAASTEAFKVAREVESAESRFRNSLQAVNRVSARVVNVERMLAKVEV